MKLWCFTKLHFSGRNVISIGEGISLLKDGGCHDTSPSADEFRWFQFTIMILELKSPPIHQTNGPRCTQAPHFGIFVPLQHLNKLKLCTTSPATRRTRSYDQSGTCRWTTCTVGISGYRWTMVNWWTDQVTVEQSTLSSKLRLKRTLWTRGWKLPRLWNLPLGFCRCGTESCPLTALFAPFEWSRNQGIKDTSGPYQDKQTNHFDHFAPGTSKATGSVFKAVDDCTTCGS